MRAAGTPVTRSAHSGVCVATCAASGSKPSVWRATNARSTRPSAMSTCIMPSASAASVPGRTSTVSSDCAAASVSRTSMVITWAPRRRAAVR